MYLKIESYKQLIKNSQCLDACSASYSCDNRKIKSLKYVYNKGLISYIKTLFKIKNNPLVMMVYRYN